MNKHQQSWSPRKPHRETVCSTPVQECRDRPTHLHPLQCSKADIFMQSEQWHNQYKPTWKGTMYTNTSPTFFSIVSLNNSLFFTFLWRQHTINHYVEERTSPAKRMRKEVQESSSNMLCKCAHSHIHTVSEICSTLKQKKNSNELYNGISYTQDAIWAQGEVMPIVRDGTTGQPPSSVDAKGWCQGKENSRYELLSLLFRSCGCDRLDLSYVIPTAPILTQEHGT